MQSATVRQGHGMFSPLISPPPLLPLSHTTTLLHSAPNKLFCFVTSNCKLYSTDHTIRTHLPSLSIHDSCSTLSPLTFNPTPLPA